MSAERENVYDYAQRRANETGRPYLIDAAGCCYVDCPHNRRVALDQDGGVIAARIYPNYSPLDEVRP